MKSVKPFVEVSTRDSLNLDSMSCATLELVSRVSYNKNPNTKTSNQSNLNQKVK